MQALNDITNNLDMHTDASSSTITEKKVIKRNGTAQTISREKLTRRLEALLDGLAKEHINIEAIVTKVIDYSQNGNTFKIITCRAQDN